MIGLLLFFLCIIVSGALCTATVKRARRIVVYWDRSPVNWIGVNSNISWGEVTGRISYESYEI